ncbi:hypothetical protein [Spirochaeta cellobiosiphila]|uniref:hypothetical protein n=1 Tax=Spirochaeta cellobiosiphila TaxID=504483 RepID=UPI0004029AB5|nr:hypothetical protein [Spirochaeta cellobiosiphila]
MVKIIRSIILLLVTSSAFTGCMFFLPNVSISSYYPKQLDNSIRLGTILIEPSHTQTEVMKDLPDVIKSVASQNELTVNSEVISDLVMNVSLYRKPYYKKFKQYESVTVIVDIVKDSTEVASVIYTDDITTPLESFSQIYRIFDILMKELNNEFLRIQKEIEKGKI